MSQLDAIALSEAVRQRLTDFAADNNFVPDPRLTDICRQLWGGPPERGGMVSDLWVEGAFPAEQAPETLDALVQAGHFNGDLRDQLHQRGAVPQDRLLYAHQRDALRAARGDDMTHRPALVVTAGTGAGKTESFLLPILNELWTQPKLDGAGVQCLILYPMNALVNDQVERLYDWLRGQSRLTLFNFTGETPEDKRAAEAAGMKRCAPCRFRTRQQARGLETAEGKKIDPQNRGPVPDILITNYSMLEYMLCRPQDAVFFGPALRAVVLDEAHLYTGTLAAEITLLLRRLNERSERRTGDILQIATSATIGSGAPEDLISFAATLFSKDPAGVHVIAGQAARPPLPAVFAPATAPSAALLADDSWLTGPTLTLDADGKANLSRDDRACRTLTARLAALTSLVPVDDDRPAVLLHNALGHAPLLHQVEKLLWEQKRLPLTEMALALWGNADAEALRATTTLLQLGASARCQVGDYPLLPHRIHLLVRPADGLSVCLNPDCMGDPALRLPDLGCVLAGTADTCLYCAAAMLTLMRCGNCGFWVLAGVQNLDGLRPVKDSRQERQTLHFFSRLPVAEAGSQRIDRQTGAYGAGADGLELWNVGPCPQCDTDAKDAWEPFSSNANLTLAILAETALAALPPYPAAHRDFLPAQGRRMLAFSDSRTEAARLGPRLTRQHETQLVRAVLSRALAETPVADAAVLGDLQDEITALEERLLGTTLTAAQRQRGQKQLDEATQGLTEATAGGALEDWAEAAKRQSSVPQLPDADMLSSDDPADWREQPQAVWESHKIRVGRRLPELLARELARPTRRQASLETLGLAEVTYPGLDSIAPPADLLGMLPKNEARTGMRACWADFLAALCDTLRTDSVLTLGEEQDAAYDFGGAVLGKWAAADSEGKSRLVRFVGTTDRQTRRKFACAVLKACGLREENAKELSGQVLRAAFTQLHEKAGSELAWLEAGQKAGDGAQMVPAIRIAFSRLALRRPSRLFRCPTTGHLWPRSVLGCAPESGCVRLEAVTEEALDMSPRVGRQRREFRQSSVFSLALWADEHSAQLAAGENRRLQDLFKAGARNILSSTTTLELGIDIGGLNAVLMGNVPPGKANYLQRAGRAGRRADGSSIVLTFCRLRPFDREVFRRFGDYLNRPLRRPRVFLDRRRVVARHCYAFLLGEFFRQISAPGVRVGAMNAFGHMGVFGGKSLPPWWERNGPKPKVSASGPGLEAQFVAYLNELRDYRSGLMQPILTRLFMGTAMENAVGEWQTLLRGVIASFSEAVSAWSKDYDNLWTAWQSLEDELGNRSQANALHYQMAALYGTTVIEALADRQFLPRYGFPIGVQKLKVIVPDADNPHRVREEDQFRLERSGLLAMGEYVPGSQLLVGGKLVTSHGLLKSWTGAGVDAAFGLRGQMTTCVNNHAYYVFSGALGPCPLCGAVPAQNATDLLLPRHGFSSAAWDAPKFSSGVERVGRTERLTVAFHNTAGTKEVADFGGVRGLRALYREDGDLLVFNPGEHSKGFALCTKCGYAESEDRYGNGRIDLPKPFERHAPLTRTRASVVCLEPSTTVLRHQVLAARETTDVLMLDLSLCSGPHRRSEALAQTLGMALQTAGAQLLELDGREMGLLVTAAGNEGDGWGIVLYDNTPGGAGHVRELLEIGWDWLVAARQVLFVDDAHHIRCETACLDCLLTYDGQFASSTELLQRRLAVNVLDALLTGTSLPADITTDLLTASMAPGLIDAAGEARIARRKKRLSQ